MMKLQSCQEPKTSKCFTLKVFVDQNYMSGCQGRSHNFRSEGDKNAIYIYIYIYITLYKFFVMYINYQLKVFEK